MPYQLNGVTLKPGRPFNTSDGTQYPGDWLDQSTPEDRAATGIVWVVPVVEPFYDQRFYWSPKLPKDLDDLKALWVSKQKTMAGSLLTPTDWYVVRTIEDPANRMVPPEVTAYREAVRSASNARETQINACSTTDELAALVTDPNALESWPQEL